jgi:hypothetical protein
MERFNFKKLEEVEGKKKYFFKVPNRFAAFENFDDEVKINSVREKL